MGIFSSSGPSYSSCSSFPIVLHLVEVIMLPSATNAVQMQSVASYPHFTTTAAEGTIPASFSVIPKSLWSKVFLGYVVEKL